MTATSPAPRNSAEVLARYTELRDFHQQRYDTFVRRHRNGLLGIVPAFGLVVVQAFRALHGTSAPWLLVNRHRFHRDPLHRIPLLPRQAPPRPPRPPGQLLRSRPRPRRPAPQSQSGHTGTETGKELRTPGHLYERDLDLLGPNSLFGLLATVRTGPGERGVARYLTEPASYDETLHRQQAVKELAPLTTLREQIALLGVASVHQVAASLFDDWLDEPPAQLHTAVRVALIATMSQPARAPPRGLHSSPLLEHRIPEPGSRPLPPWSNRIKLRARVLPLLERQRAPSSEVSCLITEGLALMQSTTFACPKLQQLQEASLQPAGAIKLLKRLQGHLTIVEQRSKEWYLVLSLLLAAGTQAAISIAAWKHEHGTEMRRWLATWAEFEALNALATYAYEHPTEDGTYAWPDLLPLAHPPLYEALSLAHPLLPNCIPNDISLGPKTRFYLISGSNMSGKSTLLRTLGVNAVLAYAGAPVRAQSMRLTPLVIGASLSLTDSLAEGRSKFLAEVQRLSAIIDASAASPVLFLVDEIFSGTNSEDRCAAARAVLQKLLANGAIGALSTHDLALTSLATPSNSGLNVHMASPSPDDPLAFDYKLKPGINTSSSAAAILRLIGLPT